MTTKELLLRAEAGRQRYVTHVDLEGEDQPDTVAVGRPRGTDAIEAVLLERPRLATAIFPAPIPPIVTKWHLRVPDDVALLVGAAPAHRRGDLGAGVTVAMVDSGHYPHPYFAARGYDVRPAVALVPGTSVTTDPVGHGTGESANIFAVAPAATLRPYRASDADGHLVAAISAFLRAKADRPHVLTNSWGGDGPYPPTGPPDSWSQAWAAEILDAVDQGIVVLFSAGNGQFSIEPQVPGVIAAGGVHFDAGLNAAASNYASGYPSPWYPGVDVPTLSGLVGLVPRAQYLLLPIPPGSEIDIEQAQAVVDDPPDGTTGNDGWALFSGTSAAAPQLAGAAALVLAARPNLSPAQAREALTRSAIDITVGHCHVRFNHPAGPGPDLATGVGLLNASAAVDYARQNF